MVWTIRGCNLVIEHNLLGVVVASSQVGVHHLARSTPRILGYSKCSTIKALLKVIAIIMLAVPHHYSIV